MLNLIRQQIFIQKKIFLYYPSSTFIFNNKFQSNSPNNSGPTELFKQLQQMRKNLEYHKFKRPEYFNFSRDIIDSWASVDQNEDDKPCAFWFVYQNGDQLKWNYEQLSKYSKKAANTLIELGNGAKWKKCMLILPKMPDWWVINLACMRLGTPVVESTSMVTAKDIQYRLQVAKVDCIITIPRLADAVDSISSTCPLLKTKILVDPNNNSSRLGWLNYYETYKNASEEHECIKTKSTDPMQLYFTSGTTSLPKRVMHNFSGLTLGFLFTSKVCMKMERRSVFWNMADTGWAKATWSSFSAPWIAGATAFVHEMPQFNPQQTIQIFQNFPVEGLCAPATVYRMLLTKKMGKFKKLELCITGGEPLSAEVNRRWKNATNLSIYEAYGQTESPIIICNSPDIPIKLGSMGKANPLLQIALLDDNGNEVQRGKNGQIAVKVKPEWPIGLFEGYEDDPEKTNKVFVGDYYLTGDRAYMDEDGYFWYVGRADDIITSSAYRIGPYEVESVLQQHPDVLESAVIGVPDVERTEIVKAFVVLQESGKKKEPEKLKKELQEFVKKTTAPYKYPRQIEFVDQLPKTISQKIKRAELRAAELIKLKTNAENKQEN